MQGAWRWPERGFLADDGLVDRPWYRHLATGPNPANGYGALLLPELAAAKDQPALDRATARLAAAIERVAAALAPCP
jgi:N-acetylated-alpha-linked acidic dipeptidase